MTEGRPDFASHVVSEYLQFLEGDHVIEVVQAPIGGIAPPETPLDAPEVGIQIRALTSEELGELNKDIMGLRSMLEPTVLPAGMHVSRSGMGMGMGLECCMLTVRDQKPRLGQRLTSWHIHRVILALQLLGYPVCGRAAIASWTEPGPKIFELETPPVLPQLPNGPEEPLALRDLYETATIAERLPQACFEKPTRREEIALRRFSIAAAQEDDAEAIIDYVIALEGLLVPGAQAEVSFRMCLNGARYLADAATERMRIYQDLRKLYDIRSKLVHGAGLAKADDLRDWKRTARALAARGLLKAVRSAWPSAEDFTAAALT
jgi:hypothetical protein